MLAIKYGVIQMFKLLLKRSVAGVLFTLVAGLMACSEQTAPKADISTEPASITLSGQVSYRERIKLSPDAELEVVLEKTVEGERDNVKTLARYHQVLAELSPPYSFELVFVEDTITDKARYNLHAEIKVRDQLRFVSATRFDPITNASGAPIRLVLVGATNAQSVTQAKKTMSSANTAELIAGQSWVLAAVKGEIPAALKTLEPSLVPALRFDKQSALVSGFSGCNHISGGYTLQGEQIKFGMMTSTMMACGGDIDLEQAFLAGLQDATQVKIEGAQLFLLSKDAKQLLAMRAASN